MGTKWTEGQRMVDRFKMAVDFKYK
uniref:Uncharacterized protein n=1 Tax=Rhizophora mucronata TaxID=61149 RepID=A0A2P2QQQ6_RHIMU